VNTFRKQPSPSRRTRAKAETRARLLAAARRLFGERGFEGTTLRDVARAAGVAVGTVILHCGDKSTLLALALDEQLGTVLDRPRARAAGSTPRDRVRAIVAALFHSYAQSPDLARVLVRESLFVEGAGRQPTDKRLAEFLGSLQTLLQEPGALRPEWDPADAAQAIFAAYIACLIAGLRADTFDSRALLAAFDRMTAPWFPAVPRRSR